MLPVLRITENVKEQGQNWVSDDIIALGGGGSGGGKEDSPRNNSCRKADGIYFVQEELLHVSQPGSATRIKQSAL